MSGSEASKPIQKAKGVTRVRETGERAAETSPRAGNRQRETAGCGGCERRWTGTAQAHCGACHAHFGSANLFAMHRVGFQCVHPAELRNKKSDHPLMTLYGDTWRAWQDPSKPTVEWWKEVAS